MVSLRSLGTAEIDTGKTLLVPTHTVTFAAALYLVLERARKVSRAELASILWPDVDAERRGHRLRQTILQLKRLGLTLTVDRNSVSVQGEIATDIADLQGRDLLEVPSLTFLPGYDPTFSASFADWVDRRRAAVHAGITEELTARLSAARAHGDWTATRLLGNKCLEVDSVNETAVLALAEEAVMRGGKREGVAILDKYLEEIGTSNNDIRLPATVLRRRIKESVPEPTPSLSAEPPFLGRETEMEWLLKRLEIAQSGSAVTCVLVGEAGIGKSRLCTEFLKFASLQGVRVQRVGCRPADVDRPLSVFVDLVPALREMPGALGCAEATLLDLKRLTEYDAQSEQTPSPSSASDAFGRVRFALHDLFDALTEEQSVLVAIDDVQWLDPISVKMLSGIMDKCRARKLLVLLNSRPTGEVLATRISQSAESLRLTPLSKNSSSQLLSAFALGKPSEDHESDLTQWCMAVGEGNPFFLQELAKHCLQVGERDKFPPSITTVVSDRLSRLPAASLQVLQACSVLAEDSTLSRVERMLGYRPFELVAAIEDLHDQGMLRPGPEGADGNHASTFLRSRHDLLSAAALGRLGAPALAYLHRRAGVILEEELSANRPMTSMLWTCALHWHNAGDRGRALSLSRTCADHLLNVGLAADAARMLESSLVYCQTEEERVDVLSRVAVAFQIDGEWERSKETLRICETSCRLIDPESSRHNDFELRYFDAMSRTSFDSDGLVAELLPCVFDNTASPAHRVKAAAIALRVATDVGTPEVLDRLYEAVAPFLPNLEDGVDEAFEVQMVYHCIRGDGGAAIQAADRFVQAARSKRDTVRFSRALINCATTYRRRGMLMEAKNRYSEALAHCHENKLLSRIGSVHLGFVRMHLDAGDFREARQALVCAAHIPLAKDDVMERADLYFQTVRVALAEANSEAASAAYEKLIEFPMTGSFNRETAMLALRAQLLVANGADSATLRPIVENLELRCRRTRGSGLQDFETACLVRGLIAIGEPNRAEVVLTEYCEKYRSDGGPISFELKILRDALHEPTPVAPG